MININSYPVPCTRNSFVENVITPGPELFLNLLLGAILPFTADSEKNRGKNSILKDDPESSTYGRSFYRVFGLPLTQPL